MKASTDRNGKWACDQSLHSKQEVLFNENPDGNNAQIMPTCYSCNQKWQLELVLLLTASSVFCSRASLSSADTSQKYYLTDESSSEHSIVMK